ncbi:MAG: type II toxin-antitoxin system MqsA family antitoxin [Candidatus Poribacteria bacterium]|nr:type II toxin-antitoxin system MqsA family antitoxin [Candidatus Poribacteria bacterium]
MKCPSCARGELEPRLVDLVERWQRQRVIIKDVPADVCPECGEHVYTGETADRVNELIRSSVGVGVEVVIRRFVPKSEDELVAAMR